MEQDVAAGENPVRKRLLVTDTDRDPTRVAARGELKTFFEEGISFADQHALSATLDDPRQRKGNHIRHLLFRDPTYKSDERGLRIRLQTELVSQRRLAHPLAGELPLTRIQRARTKSPMGPSVL